jgi:shikimate kinase
MIQLIGPGGAGKSTVGAALALRLGWPFHDLDREFERRRADIDTFIRAHGYAAYARENVAVYVELVPHLRGSVLALSSGFMVYPAAVHPAYGEVTAAIVRSRITVVLRPPRRRLRESTALPPEAAGSLRAPAIFHRKR